VAGQILQGRDEFDPRAAGEQETQNKNASHFSPMCDRSFSFSLQKYSVTSLSG
jgi:hypothetical protein